jgi:ATP-dependent RNA helicase DeaD
MAGLEKKDIGKIDLKGAYSFFEVEKGREEQILRSFKGTEYQGRPIRVDIAGPDSGGGSERPEGRDRKFRKDFKKPFKKPFKKKW